MYIKIGIKYDFQLKSVYRALTKNNILVVKVIKNNEPFIIIKMSNKDFCDILDILNEEEEIDINYLKRLRFTKLRKLWYGV